MPPTKAKHQIARLEGAPSSDVSLTAPQLLQALFAEHGADPLLWAVAPAIRYLDELGARFDTAVRQPPPIARQHGHILVARARRQGRSWVRPGHGCTLCRAGDALFAFWSDNQARSLKPVAATLPENELVSSVARAKRSRKRALFRQADHLMADFMTVLRREQVPLRVSHRDIARMVIMSAERLAWSEALLEREVPRLVVIGTNHGVDARTLVHAARVRAIPTLYIPHAPAFQRIWQRDLPFEYAGLRGKAERTLYSTMSVDPTRITVIGNPSAVDRPMAHVARGEPLIYAAPAEESTRLHEEVALIAQATAETIVVAPHPRADRRRLAKACPPSWKIASERTLQVIMRGAYAVIQSSSGVALEALLLGIPVIDLEPASVEPTYPFMKSPYIMAARDGDEIRRAMDWARRLRRNRHHREQIRDWALSWTSPNGTKAAIRGGELINTILAERNHPPRIWDYWAEPSQ